MNRAEIERVLAESLSTPMPPEDVDRLAEGVRWLREQARMLRALPLDEVEPTWPPSVEEGE